MSKNWFFIGLFTLGTAIAIYASANNADCCPVNCCAPEEMESCCPTEAASDGCCEILSSCCVAE